MSDKYVYKIKSVLVSLSAGDVVAGCTVRSGSGLQCSNTNDIVSYNNQDNLGNLKTT